MAITIGPVVGLVGGTSARVLFETNSGGTVRVEVRRGNRVVCERDAPTTRLVPEAVTIDGLEPGVRYKLQLRDEHGGAPRRGSFRTPATAGGSFQAAVVSCNQILHEAPPAAWKRLATKVKSTSKPVDLLLHVGDQVYGDEGRAGGKSTFTRCIERLQSSGGSAASWRGLVPWVTEQYRAMYRHWWSQPAVADVLANVSNLMIWDDHEVSDDWGDDNKFADPDRPEHHVAHGAWRAFHEYQRQLWDEGARARPVGGHEGYHQVIGDVGVLFLDMRGGRGFSIYDRESSHPSSATPFLGPAQWDHIRSALTGPLMDVRLLIVACPVPLAYIGPDWADAYPLALEDDVRGQWSYRLNQAEQLQLMRTLFNWRDARPSVEIVIVSGDVHLGCCTTIERASGSASIKQLIASPIHRGAYSSLQMTALEGLIRGGPNAGLGTRPLPPEFTWRATSIVNEPNFGVVSARFGPRRPSVSIATG